MISCLTFYPFLVSSSVLSKRRRKCIKSLFICDNVSRKGGHLEFWLTWSRHECRQRPRTQGFLAEDFLINQWSGYDRFQNDHHMFSSINSFLKYASLCIYWVIDFLNHALPSNSPPRLPWPLSGIHLPLTLKRRLHQPDKIVTLPTIDQSEVETWPRQLPRLTCSGKSNSKWVGDPD